MNIPRQQLKTLVTKALAAYAHEHFCTHPRDSNNHANNEAFVRYCTPERVLAMATQLQKQHKVLQHLRKHLIAGDFDYQGQGIAVLIFEIPKTTAISADFDRTMEDVLQKASKTKEHTA